MMEQENASNVNGHGDDSLALVSQTDSINSTNLDQDNGCYPIFTFMNTHVYIHKKIHISFSSYKKSVVIHLLNNSYIQYIYTYFCV
jgi:hypothetical protein